MIALRSPGAQLIRSESLVTGPAFANRFTGKFGLDAGDCGCVSQKVSLWHFCVNKSAWYFVGIYLT